MSQSDFVSRGQALVAGGQFQEAVKVCRLGLLGRPTTVEGRVVLGLALLALKRFDEVLAEMRVALELDHTAIAAYLLKAEALLRKNDAQAALETVHRARHIAPDDRKVRELLVMIERAAGAPPSTASHPAVGFVGSGDTKHYPNHQGENGEEDSFTKPTALAEPGPTREVGKVRAALEMPSEAELEVGDRSGTVEVDPELDAVELTTDRDRDFGAVASPPVANRRPAAIVADRGQVKLARGEPTAFGKKPSGRRPAVERDDFAPRRIEPTVDLDDHEADEDDDDLYETQLPIDVPKRRPGAVSAVRNAVAMPSGPLDRGIDAPVPRPTGARPAAALPPPRGHAAAAGGPASERSPRSPQDAAGPPRGKAPSAPPPQSLPPPPRLAAALPTVAAQPGPPMTSLGHAAPPPPNQGAPMTSQGFAPLAASIAQASQPPHLPVPQQPMPLGMPSPASLAAAARPTLAISAPPPPAPAPADAPNWARATVAAADPRASLPIEPYRPSPLEPGLAAAMMPVTPAEPPPGLGTPPGPAAQGKLKTGMRRARSTRAVIAWVAAGTVVIGGGVFAGFWIRSMRLQKQIDAARDRAADLAKPDTWGGWVAARDSLAGIVQADGSSDNRAALARARGLVAFEFGDGLADAKSAVDALGGHGGLDADIAASYVALAQADAKAAKLASDAALAEASQDPAALYVAGQAALLAGDLKSAVTYLKGAVEHDARPLYRVGLARAFAASYAWDEALDAIDRVRAASPDHPAAAIERGVVLAASGRIAPGSSVAADVHAQLERMIAEGSRPFGEQQHGVSLEQVAFANLSLARVDFARADLATARTDVGRAGDVGADDQAFAEEAIATLYAIGDLAEAKKFAERALGIWPTSRRARITHAEILLAMGRPAEALDTLDKQPEMLGSPLPLAVRGEARRQGGDADGARADFENALKKVPALEPALVGRAWLDIEAGNVDDAKKLVEPHVGTSPTAAISTVYAAILRRAPDAATRDKAKAMLEKVVAGPPSVDVARAQLELARLDRDIGDFHGALTAYGEASKSGNFEARLETGLLQIDDRDPRGGRETLDALLKETGDHPSSRLVLEVARARMLVGDHAGATELIETASKLPDVAKWKLERERGRLALRRGDYPGAILALGKALDGSGADPDTFLLAADAATSGDDKAAVALADKIGKLLPTRLKGLPEAQITTGKLLIGGRKFSDALATFTAARAALDKIATPRRMAQARFGVAVANYNLKNDAEARAELDVVIALDPSLDAAYLYMVGLLGNREQRKAYELAQKAVQYNPDIVPGWSIVGQLAAKVGDRKVLADAIGRLQTIAPGSDELKQLLALRR